MDFSIQETLGWGRRDYLRIPLASSACSTLSSPLPIPSSIPSPVNGRVLLLICVSYFLHQVSLYVFDVAYNYLDFRFSWTAFQISLFLAAWYCASSFASGLGIRRLVPHIFSEEMCALFGMLIQVRVLHALLAMSRWLTQLPSFHRFTPIVLPRGNALDI